MPPALHLFSRILAKLSSRSDEGRVLLAGVRSHSPVGSSVRWAFEVAIVEGPFSGEPIDAASLGSECVPECDYLVEEHGS